MKRVGTFFALCVLTCCVAWGQTITPVVVPTNPDYYWVGGDNSGNTLISTAVARGRLLQELPRVRGNTRSRNILRQRMVRRFLLRRNRTFLRGLLWEFTSIRGIAFMSQTR